ncbi:hypothetical protein D9M70_581430 [compost metagenome]
MRGVGLERAHVEGVIDDGLLAFQIGTGRGAHGAGVGGELAGGALAGGRIGSGGHRLFQVHVQVVRSAVAVGVNAQLADAAIHRSGGGGGAVDPQLHGGSVDLRGGQGEGRRSHASQCSGQGDGTDFHDEVQRMEG